MRWTWMLVGVVACGGGEERLEPVAEAPYVPPPEACDQPDPSDPGRFVECSLGGGIFGQWQLDDAGLPSYRYGLDQHRDDRASYPVTERGVDGGALDPRRHWAAFGNERINAMVSNDGTVEVVTQDRGVSYLNVYDPAAGSHAGGFGYLDDGEEVWSTAYRWRPYGSPTERRFGMGYAESALTHRGIRSHRVVAAPPGDVPAVVSAVTLENQSDAPRTLRHYEVWDVGRRSIEINWVVSGKVLPSAPATARAMRDERNAMFHEEVTFEPAAQRLAVRRSYVGDEPRPPEEEPSAVDYYPVDPFLASLDAPVAAAFVDQAAFFGAGGPALPAAVETRMAGALDGTLSSRSATEQPHVLVLATDVTLAPGESRTLRFAYGYARHGEAHGPVQEAAAAIEDLRVAQAEALAPKLFHFAAPRAPALQRELAWHSAQIQASVGHRDYWGATMVPQGSAYLYLHGADGAARDLGLFATPLVYVDPALAKEELKLYMGIQRAEDHAFSYAFQGHGMIDDAGIHSAPSDLPLFFLWSMGEYLGATGDLAFLDELAPFYPREAAPDATAYEHVVAAVRHAIDVVGTGEHGLIRIQTGDWSDGVVVGAPDRELAEEHGESIPNTQMAVVVLPRIADLIEARDPALATEIRGWVAELREALRPHWTGTHYVRAFFGDGVPVKADSIDLEAQIWALIGDQFETPEDRATLVAGISEELDTPMGAALWSGGDVWPAISTLLTWGYAKHEPDLAWDHLARNTMVGHAQLHPEVWSGIWSAADGMSSETGWSWASEVTPMRDFPVQNNNAHCLPILAALRVAGVEASAEGLVIAPPSTEIVGLEAALVDLAVSPKKMAGTYRPLGPRRLVLRAPPGLTIAGGTVDGIPVEPGAEVTVDATGVVTFEVELGER